MLAMSGRLGRTLGRAALGGALFLLPLAVGLPQAGDGGERSISVGGTAEALTVIAEDVALHDVLDVLGRHQRLTVELHAALDERVTVEIVERDLEAVIRELLRDYNFTLERYGASSEGPAGRLWVHPRARESEPAIAEPQVVGLTDVDDPDAALERLRSGTRAERLDGAAVLTAWGGDESFVALSRALNDPDPAVREEAVAGLADNHSTAGLHLLEAALADPDDDVRQAAIDALSELDTDAAARGLAPLLRSAHVGTRRRTVDALGEMDTGRAALLLRQALQDPDEMIRTMAKEYLAERKE